MLEAGRVNLHLHSLGDIRPLHLPLAEAAPQVVRRSQDLEALQSGSVLRSFVH